MAVDGQSWNHINGVRINWASDVFQNAASSYCKYPRGFRDRFRGSHDGPMIILPSRRMVHPCHYFAIAQVNTTRQVFIERFWSFHRDRDFGKIEQRWVLSLNNENLS